MGLNINRKSVLISDNAKTTLSNNITATDTSISVADSSKFPTISNANEYFYVTLASQANPDSFEIVKVTATSGNTFTVVRGQAGTTATAFSQGDAVELRISSVTMQDLSYLDYTYNPDVPVMKDNTELPDSPYRYLNFDSNFYDVATNDADNTILNVSETRVREPLDIIYIKFSDNNITGNGILETNQGYAKDIITHWDSYFHDKIVCDVYTVNVSNQTRTVYRDKRFNTLDDMANFSNTIGDTNSKMFAIPYIIKNRAIPKIPTVFAYNKAFASLKGRHLYYNPTVTSPTYSLDDDFILYIFNSMFGTSKTTVTTEMRNTIWLSTRRASYYGAFHPNFKVKLTGTNTHQRQVYDVGSDTFFTVPNQGVCDIDIPAGKMVTYIGRSTGGAGIKILSNHEVLGFLMGGYSFLRVVYVKDSSNRKALYVKPLGIDTVIFNGIDYSRYDIEAVAERAHFKTIPLGTIPLIVDNDLKARFEVDWLYRKVFSQSTSNARSERYKDIKIRFRLIDKTTKEYGELSNFYLKTQTDTVQNRNALILSHS